MKNKLMILAGLLSLSALNAMENENDLIASIDPTTGTTRILTQKQYFLEVLNEARQKRAEGKYKEAGLILYTLTRNKNEGGKFGDKVRPGTTVANAAAEELADMAAKGQWKDDMLAQ